MTPHKACSGSEAAHYRGRHLLAPCCVKFMRPSLQRRPHPTVGLGPLSMGVKRHNKVLCRNGLTDWPTGSHTWAGNGVGHGSTLFRAATPGTVTLPALGGGAGSSHKAGPSGVTKSRLPMSMAFAQHIPEGYIFINAALMGGSLMRH